MIYVSSGEEESGGRRLGGCSDGKGREEFRRSRYGKVGRSGRGEISFSRSEEHEEVESVGRERECH